MELPLSPPRAHAALLACSSTPIVFGHRSHSAPGSSRARPLLARRSKKYRSDEDAAAEPKIITLGRPGKSRRRRNRKQKLDEDEESDEWKEEQEEEEGEEDERDAAIPEVVTNRMMRRVGVSVGAPLALGVGFFPVFYYLKAVAKVDVPTWIPFGVSFVFFGAALLGVSYGIVSASWDPAREGSLLGWNEARRNWPVFWDSLRGRSPPPPPPRRG
ncbi:protein PAM68, chloroplastic-like [Phragmites australis]|uniref:protein PAM68, chloroplastic-like n=1 Tax=Phragmites australis TaxID=29695 RepID=UPI002D767068|nr:protein PAM68, chloroplastic-like [Phragmites australis]